MNTFAVTFIPNTSNSNYVRINVTFTVVLMRGTTNVKLAPSACIDTTIFDYRLGPKVIVLEVAGATPKVPLVTFSRVQP